MHNSASAQPHLSAPQLTSNRLIDDLGEVAYTSTGQIEWTPTRWAGVLERRVTASLSTGFRVIVLKMEPETFLDVHFHPDEFEQVFILAGDFSDGTHSLAPGDYILRRPGHKHIAYTKNGAEVLVIFNKVGSL